jgi:hypothetical protein
MVSHQQSFTPPLFKRHLVRVAFSSSLIRFALGDLTSAIGVLRRCINCKMQVMTNLPSVSHSTLSFTHCHLRPQMYGANHELVLQVGMHAAPAGVAAAASILVTGGQDQSSLAALLDKNDDQSGRREGIAEAEIL